MCATRRMLHDLFFSKSSTGGKRFIYEFFSGVGMRDEDFFSDERIKDALKKAKRLEEQPLSSDKDIVEVYKKGMEESVQLKKMLHSAWFIHDADAPPELKLSRKKKR